MRRFLGSLLSNNTKNEIAPSASETLKQNELFEANLQTLAWAILKKHHDSDGAALPNEFELQFASLEVYQSSIPADGFASLFYNDPELIPHMLKGTTTADATRAHDLLVQGLERLGLTPETTSERIRENGMRLVAAIEDSPAPGDETLLDDFESLEEEFIEHAEHLDDAMLKILLRHKNSFVSFP